MLLIAAVVLILIAAVLSIAILTLNAGSAGAGAQHLSATQAFSIAESGLERGILEWKNTASPNTYTGNPAPVTVGNGRFVISADGNDFNGGTLPSAERHISSTGTIAATGATRRVEAIVGPANLMPVWANTNFNQPAGACIQAAPYNCTPTGWYNLSGANPGGNPYQPWQDTAGPDGSRAAYVYKDNNGKSAATTAGSYSFAPPVTVTVPVTLTVGFDYSAHLLGSGGASNYMQLSFTLHSSTTAWSTATFLSGDSGGWQHGTLTVNITGTGSVDISSLEFNLLAKAGQAQQIWLDNITIAAPGDTTPQIMDWREVFP